MGEPLNMWALPLLKDYQSVAGHITYSALNPNLAADTSTLLLLGHRTRAIKCLGAEVDPPEPIIPVHPAALIILPDANGLVNSVLK